MSASRLLLLGTTLRNLSLRLVSKQTVSFKPIRFHLSTSSAALYRDTEPPLTSPAVVHHPWPELVAFVDRLKTKGYFTPNEPQTQSEILATFTFYKDINLVKDACLSFARDRYDVFKSLPLEDIQTVVESGCPNLYRKAVNSAKRLRYHARLDEGDVCSACNLRGSCDRAYVILKDSEAAARTVDIVRILLIYALDPLVISGGEKPPGRERVDASARKLLSELIKLSEKSTDPALPKPAAKARPEKKEAVTFNDDELSQNVEMRRGDWMCTKCSFMNFAKNMRCLKCNEDGPTRVGADDIEMRKGDWMCLECKFLNFSRNKRCLKCKAEGPSRVAVDEVKMKKGDWNCPQCKFMNFSSNKKCLRCQERRPKRQLEPGEWECPSCDFLNYRRNVACRKCNCERPKDTTPEYGDHVWRSSR
ncbi:zf-RanBP domain-containing protein [Cephalotus follicularis]|uniref:Zf-RanBP domain-containing protein n=1 Tax=Cephalotus follicularis TaxID=3775 RepID=A0A1Q3DB28_CEPFO|nr:zf-RanBP domain-containing protein [Cephalotus follicularis]